VFDTHGFSKTGLFLKISIQKPASFCKNHRDQRGTERISTQRRGDAERRETRD
jgi:hypothetical protein